MKTSGDMRDTIMAPLVLQPRRTKILRTFCAFVAVLAFAGGSALPAGAQTLRLRFRSDPSGIAIGGSGTAAAAINFGSVQAYGGTVPTGVTKTLNGTTSWTLSTPIDVRVNVVGFCLLCSTYTMTAQLQTLDSRNTWTFGSAVVTSAAPVTITTTGSFSKLIPYTLSLTIPFSEPAGIVSNTLNIVVTAN
jgi:hypothetical protein